MGVKLPSLNNTVVNHEDHDHSNGSHTLKKRFSS